MLLKSFADIFRAGKYLSHSMHTASAKAGQGDALLCFSSKGEFVVCLMPKFCIVLFLSVILWFKIAPKLKCYLVFFSSGCMYYLTLFRNEL